MNGIFLLVGVDPMFFENPQFLIDNQRKNMNLESEDTKLKTDYSRIFIGIVALDTY